MSIFCKKQEEKIKELQSMYDIRNKDAKDYSLVLTDAENQIIELKKLIVKNPNEDLTNNKYPKIDIHYLRHETDGDYQIDVRQFINPFNYLLPKLAGQDDDLALQCLKWVISNITYIEDKKDYNYDEYWAYSYQTLQRKKGDCEDGAILLANILLSNGIPYWKIRITAGDTTFGGHAYVNYFYEKGNYWVTLDWCYFKNMNPINQRIDYKNDKLYGNVWFSFNSKYAFSLGTSGQILK